MSSAVSTVFGVDAQPPREGLRRAGLGAEPAEHALEQLGIGVALVVEELVGLPVVPGVQEHGPARLAVAARAADLLGEALEGAGQRGVDHGADVGLVDPHAEGDGGDHHLEPPGQELGLDLLALRGAHAGVVGGDRKSLPRPAPRSSASRARGDVDDGGPARRVGQEPAHRLGPLRRGEARHFDRDVLAAEPVDEAQGREPELDRDVVLHAGSGGGGEGDDGGGPQPGQAAAQQPIVGPEVVAPFRDAVGLVHGDERGRAAGQRLGEAGDAEALGGDEEEVEPAVEVGAEGPLREPAVAAGVDALGAQAQALELGDLVFHEGDEGRDHEGRAAAGEAGELVAERLARARGHDQQHVLALGHGPAHGLLPRAEGLEAERRPQQVVRGRSARSRRSRSPRRWRSRATLRRAGGARAVPEPEPARRGRGTPPRCDRDARRRRRADRGRGEERRRPARGIAVRCRAGGAGAERAGPAGPLPAARSPPASVAFTSARTWSSILFMNAGEIGLAPLDARELRLPTRR